MNDHTDPNDHTDHTNPNDPLDSSTGAPPAATDADARIDALARAAGSQLRRPAPADGIGRARRTTQRRQATRAALTGTAVLAVVAIGVITLTGRDDRSSVVPATIDSTDSTDATETTNTPDTVEDTSPGTTAPTATVPDTVASTSVPTTSVPTIDVDPDAIWASTEPFPTFGSQVTTIDPTTGAVTGTLVIDDALTEASRAAQDELVPRVEASATYPDDGLGIGLFRYELAAGDIVYGNALLPTEIPSLDLQDPAALPFFDRCEQAELTVTGADGAALPDRARSISMSADRSRLLVVSSDCPDAGTLADGVRSSDFELTFQVFDAARPDLPGRTLATGVTPSEFLDAFFSPDARFLAVQIFGEYRYFDVEAGTEIDRDVVLGAAGCTSRGTMWSRFIGPWVGDSTLAVVLDCGDRSELLVLDLAPGGSELRMQFPFQAEAFELNADVRRDVVDPLDARFTMCNAAVGTCWIGNGDRALVEVPGSAVLSFLPLGFNYGG